MFLFALIRTFPLPPWLRASCSLSCSSLLLLLPFLLLSHHFLAFMPSTDDHLVGVLLCAISTVLLAASAYVLLDNVPPNCSDVDATCSAHSTKEECSITPTFAGGNALTTLMPLSSIPLLIFLMVRYVALRLYLRN